MSSESFGSFGSLNVNYNDLLWDILEFLTPWQLEQYKTVSKKFNVIADEYISKVDFKSIDGLYRYKNHLYLPYVDIRLPRQCILAYMEQKVYLQYSVEKRIRLYTPDEEVFCIDSFIYGLSSDTPKTKTFVNETNYQIIRDIGGKQTYKIIKNSIDDVHYCAAFIQHHLYKVLQTDKKYTKYKNMEFNSMCISSGYIDDVYAEDQNSRLAIIHNEYDMIYSYMSDTQVRVTNLHASTSLEDYILEIMDVNQRLTHFKGLRGVRSITIKDDKLFVT